MKNQRLTRQQQAVLDRWFTEDPELDYTAIRALLIEHGLPSLSRSVVSYYRVRSRKKLLANSKACPTCGQKLVHSSAPV